MKKTSFAYDINLEFPIKEKRWQHFFDQWQVKCVSYEDMAKLTEDLTSHCSSSAYLPAANQYYLRKDPFYHGAATALTNREKSTTFKSVLVVKRESSIERWDQLEGKRLGMIHRYCTSSYFGAAIFFEKQGVSMKRFFSEIIPVGAWQKQIDGVVEGKVEATMVMEEVWLNEPKNARTTRIIDSMTGLPAPSVLISKSVDPQWEKEFVKELLEKPHNMSEKTLFSGFAPYQNKLVELFFMDAERALCG